MTKLKDFLPEAAWPGLFWCDSGQFQNHQIDKEAGHAQAIQSNRQLKGLPVASLWLKVDRHKALLSFLVGGCAFLFLLERLERALFSVATAAVEQVQEILSFAAVPLQA